MKKEALLFGIFVLFLIGTASAVQTFNVLGGDLC